MYLVGQVIRSWNNSPLLWCQIYTLCLTVSILIYFPRFSAQGLLQLYNPLFLTRISLDDIARVAAGCNLKMSWLSSLERRGFFSDMYDFCVIMQWISLCIGTFYVRVYVCVLMCPWVCPSLQTQPSTAVETQGLQLMASRSWLRDFRWEITCWLHVFNGKAANGKQEQSRMSPGMNNKSTWNISKWRQVRIEGQLWYALQEQQAVFSYLH